MENQAKTLLAKINPGERLRRQREDDRYWEPHDAPQTGGVWHPWTLLVVFATAVAAVGYPLGLILLVLHWLHIGV